MAAVAALTVAACTDDEPTGPTTTTVDEVPTSVDDPLSYTAYVDPATPVVAAVGERFALVLDAEPTEGYRWEVVSEVDRAIVLPLGSQFVRRDAVPDLPTTTVAPPPPVDEPIDAPSEGGAEPTEPTTTAPPTTAPPTTEPTPPSQSLQVLSYVARAPGTTTVELRYVRVGQPDAEARTVVFTIEVPEPPPLFPAPPEEGGEEPTDEAG